MSGLDENPISEEDYVKLQDAGLSKDELDRLEERLWEAKIAKKIMNNMRAVWRIRTPRDNSLVGLLNPIT